MVELAYVERTTNQACTATSEATADTILTLAAVVADGSTPIIIEFCCPSWSQTTTTAVSFLPIFDAFNGGAAAAVGRIWDTRGWVASAFLGGFMTQWRLLPAAGSHVFSIRGHVSAASTFTVNGGAAGTGTNVPSYLRALRVEVP